MGKKPKDAVAAVLATATGKPVEPYKTVRIDECAPNDWNPNKMSADVREKLTRGIKMLLDSVGHIPPIIVRPHPDPSAAKWQIIDGFHRWDILRAEGREMVDAYVINVDTKTAMILTDTLNYLRGEPDPDLYVKYYQRLLVEGQMTLLEASQYLPETQDEIREMLDNYNIHIDHLEIPNDSDGVDSDLDADPFLEVKFVVTRTQQEVIERELARIGALLDGKNVRGRALEFMAVNSSQTPVDNLMGAATGGDDVDEGNEMPSAKMKRLKKKLKERAS